VIRSGRLDRYTPSRLNARPGCAGNRFANPAFAPDDSAAGPGLTRDSPFASGGVPLASLLPPGVEAVDFTGRPFAPDPSVGAFQAPFVALEGVAVGGGPRGPVRPGSRRVFTVVPDPADADLGTCAWSVIRDRAVVESATGRSFVTTLVKPGACRIALTVTDRLGHVLRAPDVRCTVGRSRPLPPHSRP